MKKKGLIALTLCLALACPAALAETVDMIDVLLNSKTTQAFTQEDLAEEDLNTILLCGINAQSAMNSQPWHFSVLTDDETLAALDSGSSAPTGAEDESGGRRGRCGAGRIGYGQGLGSRRGGGHRHLHRRRAEVEQL